MTTPGTVSRTSPERITGRASSCRPVNCSLARGLRDAEKVLRGIGHIRQVGEGALPSHRHVGAE